MSYSRRPNPVWLFTDLEGNILDDNYYMSFLQNVFPYLPENVYQDDQGSIPWANPLQFHPDGTLPDNLYFTDGAVYRLEIRRGPLQSDPLIRLIENFVGDDNITPVNTVLPIENQATNPQFATVFFNNSTVINNNGNHSYDIAPGWVLDLESSAPGVVTVTRTPVTGSDAIPVTNPTNPSYVLSVEVTSGTFTVVNLRQRFDHAPAIWAQEGISVSLTAKVLAGSDNITVLYVPSDATLHPEQIIIDEALSTVYQTISGGIQLAASDSGDTADNGYVDIVFELPTTGTTFITSVQIFGSETGASFVYGQTSVERQIDQTFHTFKDALLRQPKDSLLAGWTFGLNPWQFYSITHGTVAANEYTADQTIMLQQKYVADNVGSNVAVTRGTAAQNYAYVVTAVTNNSQFGICQYMAPAIVRPYWGKKVSCMVNAKILTPTHSSIVKVKARLLYRTSLPSTISRTEPIASWNVGEDPTSYAAGWTAITPLNDPEYTLTSADANFSFDQFQLPASSNDSMTLALLVYTVGNMASAATADVILIDRISLVVNDFALDVAEVYDEAVSRCQFYYESSYNPTELPGTVTDVGLRSASTSNNSFTNASPINAYPSIFTFEFNTIKNKTPVMTFYSPNDINPDKILSHLDNDGVSATSLVTYSTNYPTPLAGLRSYSSGVGLNGAIQTLAQVPTNKLTTYVTYHFVADARLGT